MNKKWKILSLTITSLFLCCNSIVSSILLAQAEGTTATERYSAEENIDAESKSELDDKDTTIEEKTIKEVSETKEEIIEEVSETNNVNQQVDESGDKEPINEEKDVEYTEKTIVEAAGDYEVTVVGMLPEDATLQVTPVSGDELKAVTEILQQEDPLYVVYDVLDISILLKNGDVYQPVDDGNTVQVSIKGLSLPAEAAEVEVIRIEDNLQDITVLEADSVSEDEATFETEHFTDYAFASTSSTDDTSTTTTLLAGPDFNVAIKQLVKSGVAYTTDDNTITSIQWTDEAFTSDTVVSVSSAKTPVYARLAGDGKTVELYTKAISVSISSGEKMFYNLRKLKTIDTSKFDTSKATTMKCMFYNCNALTELDVTGFNTAACTDMSYMFYGCSTLETLDLSGFNTSKVTTMRAMFYKCQKLQTLDIDSFDTSAVTDMTYMFYMCHALTALEISGFETSAVTEMMGMFLECKSLTELDTSSFNTAACTNMSYMFYGCSALVSVDVTGFDTSKVTTMQHMFAVCSALKNVDVSGFNTSAVKNMSYMFLGCNALASVDVTDFDTSKVANMESMFEGCKYFTELDLSNFDTVACTNMSYMFYDCSGLTTLDVSGFDTSKVTKMCAMFYECQELKELDLSNFNTSKVADMSYMFYGCNSLMTLDISSFDLTNTATTTEMLVGTAMDSIKSPQVIPEDITLTLNNTYYPLNGNGLDYERAITALNADTAPATWYHTGFIITFTGRDGSTVYATKAYMKNTIPSAITAPEVAGYDFIFWSQDGKTEYDFSLPITQNYSLIAVYKKEVYTITFKEDENSDKTSTLTLEYGDSSVTFPTPAKEGYNFLGWVDDDGNLVKDSTEVTQDLTLHASWSIKKFNVIFDYEDCNGQIVTYGHMATRPQLTPTKSGYRFVYWSSDGKTEYDFNNPVYSDLIIEPIYEEVITQVAIDDSKTETTGWNVKATASELRKTTNFDDTYSETSDGLIYISVEEASKDDVAEYDLASYKSYDTAVYMDINISIEDLSNEEAQSTSIHQLLESVTLQFDAQEDLDTGSDIILVHCLSDGTLEEISVNVSDDGKTLEFTTQSFSNYILYYNQKATNSNTTTGSDTKSNSSGKSGDSANNSDNTANEQSTDEGSSGTDGSVEIISGSGVVEDLTIGELKQDLTDDNSTVNTPATGDTNDIATKIIIVMISLLAIIMIVNKSKPVQFHK